MYLKLDLKTTIAIWSILISLNINTAFAVQEEQDLNTNTKTTLTPLAPEQGDYRNHFALSPMEDGTNLVDTILPDEILALILSFCDPKSLTTHRMVCSRWNNIPAAEAYRSLFLFVAKTPEIDAWFNNIFDRFSYEKMVELISPDAKRILKNFDSFYIKYLNTKLGESVSSESILREHNVDFKKLASVYTLIFHFQGVTEEKKQDFDKAIQSRSAALAAIPSSTISHEQYVLHANAWGTVALYSNEVTHWEEAFNFSVNSPQDQIVYFESLRSPSLWSKIDIRNIQSYLVHGFEEYCKLKKTKEAQELWQEIKTRASSPEDQYGVDYLSRTLITLYNSDKEFLFNQKDSLLTEFSSSSCIKCEIAHVLAQAHLDSSRGASKKENTYFSEAVRLHEEVLNTPNYETLHSIVRVPYLLSVALASSHLTQEEENEFYPRITGILNTLTDNPRMLDHHIPDIANTYYILGQSFYHKGNTTEGNLTFSLALTCYNKVSQLMDHYKGEKAKVLIKLGNHEEAFAVLNESPTYFREGYVDLSGMAESAAQAGKKDIARQFMERFQDLTRKALELTKLGWHEEAFETWKTWSAKGNPEPRGGFVYEDYYFIEAAKSAAMVGNEEAAREFIAKLQHPHDLDFMKKFEVKDK